MLLAISAFAFAPSVALLYKTSSSEVIKLPDVPTLVKATNDHLFTTLAYEITNNSNFNDAQTVSKREPSLMRFHYGLHFDPHFKYEMAGDPDKMPGGCLWTKYSDTRSISYTDPETFFCVVFEGVIIEMPGYIFLRIRLRGGQICGNMGGTGGLMHIGVTGDLNVHLRVAKGRFLGYETM
ncbi:hypothetical protein CC78DRAFT_585982 [Lojkania enalia]|uniref:Uncharacterized protein n=1 Tax=Lojkania enalia TaxID=147567 RepID=A0A9P4K154_9PLEO|nr:hypothetical protein CC78DRAFT_585982 [Didymosphaeria enalia]